MCDWEGAEEHQPQYGRQHGEGHLGDIHQEAQEAQEVPGPMTQTNIPMFIQ